mgnify:CR=1 FL=1
MRSSCTWAWPSSGSSGTFAAPAQRRTGVNKSLDRNAVQQSWFGHVRAMIGSSSLACMDGQQEYARLG